MKLMLELGSLKVFSKRSLLRGPHAFFWQDAGSLERQGPFSSIYDAMKDYERILKLEKKNVLYKDFSAKA